MINFHYLLIFALIKNVQSFEINMTAYFSMPKLYDFDNYDRCLEEYTTNKSVYCFVRAEILPQKDSHIWQSIQYISQYNRHHFDHKHLYFGLCVNWCTHALEGMEDISNNASSKLFAGLLTNNTKVNTYVNLFATENINREQYNSLMNKCINLRLKKHYNLQALSMIEYCYDNYEQHTIFEKDMWNIFFYALLCIFLLLIVFSTLYDFFIRHKGNKMLTTRDHYKSTPEQIYNKIFVTFSLPRNWYRLNQEPSDKIGNDLRFLDCFKFFAMFMVIFAHTVWIIYEGAIDNPQDPERMLHTPAGTLLMSGGLITITFFVISGFLLTLNWLAAIKNHEELSLLKCVSLFFQFNIFRYIRLTVPYACVLLLSGVYFDNAGGPLWRHIVEREQLSCRKNWWTNLLYINNFVNTDERCMLQTWYLAADTQCFIFSLFLLILVHKWQKVRVLILTLTAGAAIIIPGLVAYFYNFEPVFLPTAQTQKDSFIGNAQFTYFYTQFIMNYGTYLAGILAALIYDYISKEQIKLRDFKWFQCLWFALFPAAIFWMFFIHPFYQYYTDEPLRFWRAVYAAFQRNTWGFGLGIFIVGMSSRIGWIFRRFACLPMFRVLGRLTYGAYILHLLTARLVVGTIRQPIYFGTGTMFTFVFYNVMTSYLCSFVLAMLVELPVSSLLKLLR